MNKFLYQIEKEEKENCVELNLYYVNSNKETIIEKKEVPYSILVKEEEFKTLKIKTEKINISNKKYKNKQEENIVEILIESKELFDYIYKLIREQEFKVYEADLSIEHKYLIDNQINLLTKKDNSLPENPLKTISFDIETIGDKDNQEIVLISTHSYDNEKLNLVYTNEEKIDPKFLNRLKKEKYKEFEVKFIENEKKLLEEFKKDIIEFNPQAIIGWNNIDFDFKVIRDRMKEYSIEFKFSKYCKDECKLRVVRDFFRDSSMQCSGVLIFDIIQVLKSNYISFDDYKLNTVAKEVLSDEKIDLEYEEDDSASIQDKISAISNLLAKNPKKLIEYNFKDSELVSQITSKLGLLKLMFKRSIITNTPLTKVKSPIATLDIMYLKKLHKLGYVADSNFNFQASSPIEGAFVLSPKKGFYEDIFVLDFKSLYPSIIMTFNLDPFTYSKNGTIEAPNNSKFSSKPGILPELILKLYKERDIAKKEKDDVKNYALKITMNSFYGAVASPKSRLYNKDVGEAITSFGRFIIQKAKGFVEDKNIKAVYGDTDSIFVKISGLEGKSLEDKKNVGKLLENDLNEYFYNWVEEEFKQKSFLNIEFEKLYSKFFIASKKRYVGFDELSHKTQFVGLEAIRGDWTELAKNFQKNLINQIFGGAKKEKIEKFIKDEISKLKKGDFDSELVYTKKITKPLNQYIKTTPPHVRAARELKEFEGRIVKYVMTKNGPKHISLVNEKPNYDYEHYIEKQLKGVSDDILECFGIDFDKVIESSSQKSLNRFFG